MEKKKGKSTEWLVIGRFQLVGNQHADLFRQVEEYSLRSSVDRLNVGIGVADSVDETNPYTGTECLAMIRPIADALAQNMGVPVRYRLIPDLGDAGRYCMHVAEIFGFGRSDDVTLFSSNEDTSSCFREVPGYSVVDVEETLGQHSSQLRKLYAHGYDISSLVPSHVPDFLESHGSTRRLEKILFDNPVPAVDVVIGYMGGVVIIYRSEEPEGLALPGGHIEYGESVEDAAVREAKEETGLDIRIDRLIGVFSDPARDPRGHRISIAYAATGYGELDAGSDAKEVMLGHAYVRGLMFDHDKILEAYRGEADEKSQ